MPGLKNSPLVEFHREMGAKTIPFHGWTIPSHFPGGTVQEHLHTRESCSIFDLVWRQKYRIAGAEAAAILTQVAQIPVDKIPVGAGQTLHWHNPAGGVTGVFYVSRMAETDFFLTADPENVFTANDLQKSLPPGTEFNDLSEALLTLGIYGPRTLEVLQILGVDTSNLPHSGAKIMEVDQLRAIVQVSPETGEIGYELHLNAEHGDEIWDLLLEQEFVNPGGWHAWQSLRLETGVWSANRELRPEWAIKPDSSSTLPQYRVVGLQISGRVAPPSGALICNAAGEKLGEITSAGLAPSLGSEVALGVIAAEAALPAGSAVTILAGDLSLTGCVVPTPFRR